MSSLADIKRRLASVKQTRRITGAMKTVSIAKMRKASENYEKSRAYAALVDEIMKAAATSEGEIYFSVNDTLKKYLLVLSTDRGLCGGFDHDVLRLAGGVISGCYADRTCGDRTLFGREELRRAFFRLLFGVCRRCEKRSGRASRNVRNCCGRNSDSVCIGANADKTGVAADHCADRRRKNAGLIARAVAQRRRRRVGPAVCYRGCARRTAKPRARRARRASSRNVGGDRQRGQNYRRTVRAVQPRETGGRHRANYRDHRCDERARQQWRRQ